MGDGILKSIDDLQWVIYVIGAAELERAVFTLLEKIYRQSDRALVVTADPPALSRRLWVLKPKGFLPHGCNEDSHPEDQPIWLSDTLDNRNQAEHLMVLEPMDFAQIVNKNFRKCLIFIPEGQAERMVEVANLWKNIEAKGQSVRAFHHQGGWQPIAEHKHLLDLANKGI